MWLIFEWHTINLLKITVCTVSISRHDTISKSSYWTGGDEADSGIWLVEVVHKCLFLSAFPSLKLLFMPGLRYCMWLYLRHIFLEESTCSTAWPIHSIRHWADCSGPAVDVWQEYWINLWPLAVASQESRPLRRLTSAALPASPLPQSGRGRQTVLDPDICTCTCRCETKQTNRKEWNILWHTCPQQIPGSI